MNRSFVRNTALTLAAVAVLGLSSVAMAAPDNHPGQPGPVMTAEQEATFRKLHQDFANSTENIRKQIVIKEAELKAQMMGQAVDAKKVESLSQELGSLRGQMMVARKTLEIQLEKEGLSACCGFECMDGPGQGGRGHRGGMGRHGGGHWQSGNGQGGCCQ